MASDGPAKLAEALADRYRIERELGAGGMATVYLAHDVRHARKVALKVLRPELSAILGGERFLAEIKTTANLQHPHILSLFDSGEVDGLVFYVMPFVEGESLRDRLNREKQLPVDDAVRIAREVADALAYAHSHGIVHRDIKPENILLHGGHAMVADFGIALAASRSDGGTRMTETGLSLGTPNYMSPEQAMGEREITPKVDIYALGCVLYEMLAGEPPFTGPTAQAIIARVMTEQPRPLTTQRHTIPPQLEAVIHKALEKLPADRFASAAGFSEALANPAAFAAAGGIGVQQAIGSTRRDWRSRVALPALGVALVMTVLTTWAFLVPAPEAPVARYSLALPAAQTQMFNRQIAIAPDGSSIVFMGNSPAGTFVPQLYIKRRDASDASVLQGTIGAQSVAFSPDSRWIAFGEIGGRLRKLQIDGGAALVVADSAASSIAPAWLDDGTIVYVRGGSRGLLRVPETGGKPAEVWPPDSGTIREVRALPGSKGVLISRCQRVNAVNNCSERSIWVLDLESRSARQVAATGVAARYLETGHVLVVRGDGAAFAIPFNLRRLEPREAIFPAFDSVAINSSIAALMDVSNAGTLVMIQGASGTAAKYTLHWVDRTGRETPVDLGGPISLNTLGNGGWALSPDGKRLAIGILSEGNEAIWVKALPSGPLSRITLDSAISARPRWLPGGQELTYIANEGSGNFIRRVSANGTSAAALVMQNARGIFEGAQTPDGKWIVARTSGGIGRQGRDIIGYRAGDTVAVPLIANPSVDEAAFAISPNGRWIAYESDETGRREVYVRPFPATNTGKWQVSTAGGMAPLWSRNGRELYFVDGARKMIGVAVTEGPTPGFGDRNALFTLSPFDYLDDNTYYTPFDVGPDGRFIMARLVGSSADSPPLVLVENWYTELQQKLQRK